MVNSITQKAQAWLKDESARFTVCFVSLFLSLCLYLLYESYHKHGALIIAVIVIQVLFALISLIGSAVAIIHNTEDSLGSMSSDEAYTLSLKWVNNSALFLLSLALVCAGVFNLFF